MNIQQHTAYSLSLPCPCEPPNLQLYSDGAYFEQQQLGGWGVAVFQNAHRLTTLRGTQISDSSLEMELIAAIKAIQWAKSHSEQQDYALYTDSKILLEGLFEKTPHWQNNHWQQKNGTPIAFSQLWQQLHHLATTQPVYFYWVKAHAHNAGNQVADQLARHGIIEPFDNSEKTKRLLTDSNERGTIF